MRVLSFCLSSPSLPSLPSSLIHTRSPQVALRIIVPKIQSTNEKVGLLALTVSNYPHEVTKQLRILCAHRSVYDIHTHVHVHMYCISYASFARSMCIVGTRGS